MKQKPNKQTTDFIPIIDYTDDGIFVTKSYKKASEAKEELSSWQYERR